MTRRNFKDRIVGYVRRPAFALVFLPLLVVAWLSGGEWNPLWRRLHSVDRIVDAGREDVRRCFGDQIDRRVWFQIEPSGSVAWAMVDLLELAAGEDIAECVRQRVSAWRFQRQAGASVTTFRVFGAGSEPVLLLEPTISSAIGPRIGPVIDAETAIMTTMSPETQRLLGR